MHICTTRRSSLFSMETTLRLSEWFDSVIFRVINHSVCSTEQNRTRGGIFITQLVNMNVFLVAGLSVSRFKSMWVYSCVLVLTFSFHVLICAAQFLCCMFLCCAASPPISGFCFTIPPSQVWWRLLFTIQTLKWLSDLVFSLFILNNSYSFRSFFSFLESLPPIPFAYNKGSWKPSECII